MDKWRLVITKPLSAQMNMSIDEAILLKVSEGIVPPTIRFYQWSSPTISLGYFQSFEKEVEEEVCQQAKVEVVRRLTGGRAVLHHREFTYSLVAPDNNKKVAGTVLQSYLAISRGLMAGLQELGVEAELTEGKQSKEHLSAACFDAPSWYEMVVKGKKLIGSAQTKKYGALLQHGSVPFYTNEELLFSTLKFNSEEIRARAKKIFLTKATSLSEAMESEPQFEEVSRAFKIGFEKGLSIELCNEELTTGEIELANRLCGEKYSTEEWNRRR